MLRTFHELWEVEPWGLIRGALGVLERIWVKKRRSGVVVNGKETLLTGKNGDVSWIEDLRGSSVDWLIL